MEDEGVDEDEDEDDAAIGESVGDKGKLSCSDEGKVGADRLCIDEEPSPCATHSLNMLIVAVGVW